MITSRYHHQFTLMYKKTNVLNIYLVLILFVFSFFIISQSAYADKELKLEKTVDVKSQVLLETLSDLKSYPQIFPQYIKSVELTGQNSAKFNVGSNGIFFDVQTQYSKFPDGSYLVEVTSGDLKGSKITTKLQETWGFDGTPNGGTKINMEISLQTSGILSLLAPSIPDRAVLSNLDTGLDKFAAYAKSKSEKQSMLKNESHIKSEAMLWSKGSIDDTAFALEIQHMIKYGMVKVPQIQQDANSMQIPSWVKTNAGWWADGKISDEDFDSTIQYLISSKIMIV
jgi:hypothetical protein